ncbi:MAG: gamma-glutamyltransferase, partial [Gemmatimonadota bacterium]|nr:gamma-glutamyltransferase [Gemmatimonadota bacterium]
VKYRGYRLYGMQPPSSGGATLGLILGLLEPFDLGSMGHNAPSYVHHLVEAERLAFADRNRYLGDPDFVEVPLEGLLSASYLDSRRRLIPQDIAGRSEDTPPGRLEAMETTHFCVVDRWGGCAAVTTTINGGYGMGAVVPGAGFFLNNEMDDFSAAPGEPNAADLVLQGRANAIAPGKRMLSSMTPTIVTRITDNGTEEPFLVVGAAGGPTIITSVLQIFLNVAHFGMNVREAMDAPRFHHQHLPDLITIEPRTLSGHARVELTRMGYSFKARESIGSASAITVLPGGVLEGWADGAGIGAGTGY